MSDLFLSELYSDCAAELRSNAPVALTESPAITVAREAARARMDALGVKPVTQREHAGDKWVTPVEPPLDDGPHVPALLREQAT